MKSASDPVNISDKKSLSEFKRYRILTKKTKHRSIIPHRFIPKVRKTGLASILIFEIFTYNFKLIQPEYRRLLLSRPCIYGVFSGAFGGFNPIVERCVGCMRCVQEYPGVCRVERNPDFGYLADKYWMPQDPANESDSPFATVLFEAETGKIEVRGMGYKGHFAGNGWDVMWTDMSEIVRPTRDGVYGREFISTSVELGKKPEYINNFTENDLTSLSIPIPIVFDLLPDNLTSKSILQSVANASKEVQSYFIVYPDQIEKFGIEINEMVIPFVNGSDLDMYSILLSAVQAIMVSEDDLELIPKIKEINPFAQVMARIKVTETVNSRVAEVMDHGVESILLAWDYHGLSFDEHPTFVKEDVEAIHAYLVQNGMRDRVSLIASGGIISAEHVPKAIISGADVIALNTSALVALQVKMLTECRDPDMSEIDDILFDVAWGAQRLVNLLGSWHNQLIEIMSAMGIKEVRRLRGDRGRAMYHNELEEVAFSGITRID